MDIFKVDKGVTYTLLGVLSSTDLISIVQQHRATIGACNCCTQYKNRFDESDWL